MSAPLVVGDAVRALRSANGMERGRTYKVAEVSPLGVYLDNGMKLRGCTVKGTLLYGLGAVNQLKEGVTWERVT